MNQEKVKLELKPNKQDTYDEKRDFLTENTWLYQVERYLHLVQMFNAAVLVTDENKIIFALTYFSSAVAI